MLDDVDRASVSMFLAIFLVICNTKANADNYKRKH